MDAEYAIGSSKNVLGLISGESPMGSIDSSFGLGLDERQGLMQEFILFVSTAGGNV